MGMPRERHGEIAYKIMLAMCGSIVANPDGDAVNQQHVREGVMELVSELGEPPEVLEEFVEEFIRDLWSKT